MDFILSLTHFCEVHGPTSILCSQIIPTPCSQCFPDSPDSSPNDTPFSSRRTGSPASSIAIARDHLQPPNHQPRSPELAGSPSSVVGYTTTSVREPLASPPASAPASAPRIEDHPWFMNGQRGRTETRKPGRFGGSEGDTCASCQLTLPEDVSKQLPPGSPGTLKDDGKGRHGSPVLRSREIVYSCQGSHDDDDDDEDHFRYPPSQHAHHSSPTSAHSSYSSDSSCHTHVVTYLSMRGPANPIDYALLRRASIRTLSCELLPRGLSSGPLSFGDSVTGYTIAFVFRLPDPMARGKRRSYALVALAGKDGGRAFRASPIIWRVFGRMANSILGACEKHQEREKQRELGGNITPSSNLLLKSGIGARNYTPVSSFLTGRTLDPDGHPRRAGQIRARSLTEIVGNDYIFAELHAQFVALLQQLGTMFGPGRNSDERGSLDPYDEAGHNTATDLSSINKSRKGRNDPTGHSNSSHQPPISQSPIPKPIPISQRRKPPI
ncbi:hypothetical protein FQN57_004960 [Myotisia sp. PD_48]|nr:hypothetical protein FQN57_004960 [Myotisia sp. PD_48]